MSHVEITIDLLIVRTCTINNDVASIPGPLECAFSPSLRPGIEARDDARDDDQLRIFVSNLEFTSMSSDL